MPRHIDRSFYLNSVFRLLATMDHEPTFHYNRFPGVDRLTATVLEQRVAIEATRG